MSQDLPRSVDHPAGQHPTGQHLTGQAGIAQHPAPQGLVPPGSASQHLAGQPDGRPHGLPRRMLGHALGVLVEVVVAVYVIADTLVSLLFRPLFRLLSGLRIVQRLEHAINALHPYVILVVMVVPFAIAEVAKVFAVYWMAEGHMRSGMAIFIGAYIVSIFVCERILHAGKAKLMTIPWFAWAYNWVMVVKDHVFGWFRGTAAWRAAMAMRDRAKALGQQVYARLGALFEGRPEARQRGALERR